MRLLTEFDDQAQAETFVYFLRSHQIDAEIEEKEGKLLIWIINEDGFDEARNYYAEFVKNPGEIKISAPSSSDENRAQSFEVKLRPQVFLKRKRSPLTFILIGLCIFVYVTNFMQRTTPSAILLNLTPITKTLLYDFPEPMQKVANLLDTYGVESQKAYEELPEAQKKEIESLGEEGYWRGLYFTLLRWPESKKDLDMPLFTDIRKGEVWRVISPAILHVDFLHILFNMLWLFYLGRMIEERTSIVKYLSIAVIIGVLSNTLQYLVSGPFFMGYSGIVVGMAGYIWMRQRKAPWEGYPLQRGVLIFLGIFVIGMALLQLTSFFIIRFGVAEFEMNIANTAHISGGIIGIILGRLPFFNRGGM